MKKESKNGGSKGQEKKIEKRQIESKKGDAELTGTREDKRREADRIKK